MYTHTYILYQHTRTTQIPSTACNVQSIYTYVYTYIRYTYTYTYIMYIHIAQSPSAARNVQSNRTYANSFACVTCHTRHTHI